MEEEKILVTVGYESTDLGIGLGEGVGQSIVTPIITGVSSKKFGQSFNTMIKSVASAINDCDTSSSSFEINEVELSLTVNGNGEVEDAKTLSEIVHSYNPKILFHVNGEVSILTVAGLKAGAEAAITVKLKRKA